MCVSVVIQGPGSLRHICSCRIALIGNFTRVAFCGVISVFSAYTQTDTGCPYEGSCMSHVFQVDKWTNSVSLMDVTMGQDAVCSSHLIVM